MSRQKQHDGVFVSRRGILGTFPIHNSPEGRLRDGCPVLQCTTNGKRSLHTFTMISAPTASGLLLFHSGAKFSFLTHALRDAPSICGYHVVLPVFDMTHEICSSSLLWYTKCVSGRAEHEANSLRCHQIKYHVEPQKSSSVTVQL